MNFLRRHYLESDPRWKKQRQPIDALMRQIPRLGHTMVMSERPADNPRETFLRHRGEYLSPKHRVFPDQQFFHPRQKHF